MSPSCAGASKDYLSSLITPSSDATLATGGTAGGKPTTGAYVTISGQPGKFDVHSLPPPWSDTPHLVDSLNGGYDMISAAGNVLVSFRSNAMSVEVLTFLESEASAAAIVSNELLHNGWFTRPSCCLAPSVSDKENASSTKTSSVHPIVVDGEFIAKSPPSVTASFFHKFAGTVISSGESEMMDRLLDSLLAIGSSEALTNILLLAPTANLDVILNPVTNIDEKNDPDDNSSAYSAQMSSPTSPSSECTSAPTVLCSISFAGRRFINREQSEVGASEGKGRHNVAGRLLDVVWSRLHSSVVAGFQSACASGPLMQEPLHGVVFTVDAVRVSLGACLTCAGGDEELQQFLTSLSAAPTRVTQDKDSITVSETEISPEDIALEMSHNSQYSSHSANAVNSGVAIYSGQLISDVIDALKLSLLSNQLRIVEPLFACELQCDQSQLGNLYAVLSKRRGQVVKEDIIEGTTIFLLTGNIRLGVRQVLTECFTVMCSHNSRCRCIRLRPRIT
jgi:hypothetical protein